MSSLFCLHKGDQDVNGRFLFNQRLNLFTKGEKIERNPYLKASHDPCNYFGSRHCNRNLAYPALASAG